MPNQLDRRLFLNSAAATGLTLAVTSGLPLSAQAQQDYPSRPVRIVIGFPAGGGTDVFARALAQALSASVGQQFVVDNKAGAGGIVASQSMLQTPADGYTLLMGPTSTFLVHIPYRGSAPALTDVIAGQIPLMFDSIAASGPQVRSGKVKALGIAGLARVDALPGVPTIAESGASVGLKEFDTPGWVAVYGPKGLPVPVVARLQAAIAQAMASADVAQRFNSAGATPRYMDAATLTAYEQAETRKWGEAVAYSGARLD